MKKNFVLIGLALVLTLAVVAVWAFPAPRTQVIGWLRHEATYQGKPTSYWTRAMQAGTEDVGKSLREGGSEAVPVLCEMLRDPDENVRRQVLLTLGFGETTWKEAAPALQAALLRESDLICLKMNTDLLKKADHQTAITVVRETLEKNPHFRSRVWAANTLASEAPDKKELVEPLRRAMQDSDVHVRLTAAQLLWKINKETEPIIPVFMEGMQSTDQEIGSLASQGLQALGKDAKPALPGLLELLRNPDYNLRKRAAQALGNLGSDPAVVQPLLAATKDENSWGVREAAVASLAKLGVREAAPSLIAALNDEVANVRATAAIALGRLKLKEARPALLTLVKDQAIDPGVRGSALAALAQIGPAQDILPVFMDVLKDPNEDVRRDAVVRLGRMGAAAKAAVPALTEMGKEDPEIRDTVIRALKAIDPEAAKKAATSYGQSTPEETAP